MVVLLELMGLVLAIMMTAGSSWSILWMRLDSLLASVRMLIMVVDNSLQVAKLSIIVRIIWAALPKPGTSEVRDSGIHAHDCLIYVLIFICFLRKDIQHLLDPCAYLDVSSHVDWEISFQWGEYHQSLGLEFPPGECICVWIQIVLNSVCSFSRHIFSLHLVVCSLILLL